jgi:hypothetical protein
MQPLPTSYLLNPIGTSTIVTRVYFTAIYLLTQLTKPARRHRFLRISGVAVNVLKTSYPSIVGLEEGKTFQLGSEQVTKE